MKIDILTLFPEAFTPLKTSIIGRAEESGKLEINIINIRDFSLDKHKKCDDAPFGGGAGMLMTVQPLYDAIKSVYKVENKIECNINNKDIETVISKDKKDEREKKIKNNDIVKKQNVKIIFPSPSGEVLNVKKVEELSKVDHLIFVCGHYEGVDERIFDLFPIEQISIGDYVLTGGELPTMVIIDATARFVEGVISKESLENESFSNGLLEYPQYTRPQTFMGLSVPEVLVSGNHQEIDKWRTEQSLKRTKERRSDLLSE